MAKRYLHRARTWVNRRHWGWKWFASAVAVVATLIGVVKPVVIWAVDEQQSYAKKEWVIAQSKPVQQQLNTTQQYILYRQYRETRRAIQELEDTKTTRRLGKVEQDRLQDLYDERDYVVRELKKIQAEPPR